MDAPRILIGICSCHLNGELRSVVRETWLRRLPANMTAVFFVGGGFGETEADVVQFEVADDYDTLPIKVHSFFRYALQNCRFDFLFKCDDDTYLVPERLMSLIGKGEYLGSTHLANRNVGSGGAGYLLSRRAVDLVARATPPPTGAEDIWVAKCLSENEVRFKPTPLLRWDYRRFPRPDNDLITAHWCSPGLIKKIDRLFVSETESGGVVRFHAKHRDWQGAITCYPDGFFVGGAAKPNGWWSYSDSEQRLKLRWLNWPEEVLERANGGFRNSVLQLEMLQPAGPEGANSSEALVNLASNYRCGRRWERIRAEARKHVPPWRADSACGVITAAGELYFPGFQLLYASLEGRVEVALIDAGLNQEQRSWCAARSIPLLAPEIIVPKSVLMWPAWNKSAFMQQSPFPVSLWIDSDCLVVGSLVPLFERARNGMFFVRHWSGKNYNKRNSPQLYDRFPVRQQLPPSATINSGVIGYALPRDAEFLRRTEPLLYHIASDESVRSLVSWQDEGVFHWAVAAENRTEAIVDQPGWNRWMQVGEDRPIELFGNIAANTKADDVVLHFRGAKKIWHDWYIEDHVL